eukprot:gene17313-22854_t
MKFNEIHDIYLDTDSNITNDIVISKPPSDDKNKRKPWKVKPVNNEGIQVPNPKQITKSTGVLITDYIIGYGNDPIEGSVINITYEAMFQDGTIFDSKLKRSKPLQFRKGISQVVRGLDLGLEGMRIGGSREIVIPPALGYGSEGFGPVPPDKTLVFRVTLIS